MEPTGYPQVSPISYTSAYGEPTEQIDLHISCKNLRDKDFVGESDPCVHFYIHNGGKTDTWELVGTTETLQNNLNPEFVTSFEIPFYFERSQKGRFEVYDIDDSSKELIGAVDILLAKAMCAEHQTYTAELENMEKKKSGEITIKLDRACQTGDIIHFSARAKNLPTKEKVGGLFGYDRPFYYIERERTHGSGDFIKVLQSEPIKGTTSPNWGEVKYSAKKLCNGDMDCKLYFMIYRWSEKGHHKPYGKFKTTVRKLLKGKKKYKLIDIETSEKIHKAKFYFDDLQIEVKPSFYDFLRSGWQINLTVAVDFTASNGNITDYTSLHYINPTGELNQYQSALMNVGTILTNYDTDKSITAYGFGGIPNYFGTGAVSHCFHLNGQENPQCKHVYGLMEAYKFSLENVQLHGPTFFVPCFKAFTDFVSQNLSKSIYHVFMILTDGDIHDMVDMKNLLVASCSMPISVIIIGVGENSFELMSELDADKNALKDSNGVQAARDIVQFVKFSDYTSKGYEVLSEEVLRELPNQVVDYLIKNQVMMC